MDGIDQHIQFRSYFHIIPNLLDDIGLDPYEYRLMGHYLRRGECWESTATTAKHCCMSVGKVSEVRKALAEEWGLITIQRSPKGMTIRPTDIWARNIERYERSPHEPVHHMNEDRSPHETKKNPLQKEEPLNLPAPDGAEPVYVDLDELDDVHPKKHPKWKVANDDLDRQFLSAAHPGRKYFDANAIRKKWKKIRLRMGHDPTMPTAFVDYVLAWAADMGGRGKPIGTQGIITALTEGRAFARWQKERQNADTGTESYDLEEQIAQSTDAAEGYDLTSMRDMQRRRAGQT